ncbi:tRNA methyltransferase [Mycena rebaudengoi]|nr:tRNA methyltransferase [Mycena rebaudengoi]
MHELFKYKGAAGLYARSIIIPDGFTLHTENNSHILLSSNEAFLNPIQEFNRDTSIACIQVWSEELDKKKKEKWLKSQERKLEKKEPLAKRPKLDSEILVEVPAEVPENAETSAHVKPKAKPYFQNKFVILEALSATGLRSIRYAKEIPLVRYVIANDLSSSATAAMKRNVEINGLGPEGPSSSSEEVTGTPGKVRINEGDACTLMYNHREEKKNVDVVDLDPYGSAAPFIDAAVQCIRDDGLLCVTCTDLTVLAATNYPEKCYSNYGGVPLKGEYSHEAALRLVLHSISTAAARYGRAVQPLLCLSIDFYVRLFIRVRTSPIEVKRAVAKTSTYWVCSNCQSFYGQPLARVFEKVHESGAMSLNVKLQSGPPVGEKCPECDSILHDFIGKVLEHLETNPTRYGTAARMKGMLTELPDFPFYFTAGRVSSFFHCETPSLIDIVSALLNAGHKVSRSHASKGSIKSSATRAEVFDIFRSWIKLHPVKRTNIPENSPAHRLLDKEIKVEADFTKHPDADAFISKVKLVRYQENPTAHWGPATKAVSGTTTGSKRKRGHNQV